MGRRLTGRNISEKREEEEKVIILVSAEEGKTKWE